MSKKFSYVMGQKDSHDKSLHGFVDLSEVNTPNEIFPPAREPMPMEDKADKGKKNNWKKNEMIPRRFDELPAEQDWVNVSDVIRRQREEESRREAKANKLKPPTDSESDEEIRKPRGKEHEKSFNKDWERKTKNFDKEDEELEDSKDVDDITKSMLSFALSPGIMTRRSSLPPMSSTPSQSRSAMNPYHEQRRGSLLPVNRAEYNSTHDSPPKHLEKFHQEGFRQSPQGRKDFNRHEARDRSSQHHHDPKVDIQNDREPSPDYEKDEHPPRPGFRNYDDQGRERNSPKSYEPQFQGPQDGYTERHKPTSEYSPRGSDPRYQHTEYNPRREYSDPRHDYQYRENNPRQGHSDPRYDYQYKVYDPRQGHSDPRYDNRFRQQSSSSDPRVQEYDPRHRKLENRNDPRGPDDDFYDFPRQYNESYRRQDYFQYKRKSDY